MYLEWSMWAVYVVFIGKTLENDVSCIPDMSTFYMVMQEQRSFLKIKVHRKNLCFRWEVMKRHISNTNLDIPSLNGDHNSAKLFFFLLYWAWMSLEQMKSITMWNVISVHLHLELSVFFALCCIFKSLM